MDLNSYYRYTFATRNKKLYAHHGRLPSQIEVNTAIKGMASEKASGKSGVTTDAPTSLQILLKANNCRTINVILNHGIPIFYPSYIKEKETQTFPKIGDQSA
jgi:hypothetical protein